VQQEKNRSAAQPDHFMTHLSVTEGVGPAGPAESEWGDHVTDEEYGGTQ